jgi:hypothetical protein
MTLGSGIIFVGTVLLGLRLPFSPPVRALVAAPLVVPSGWFLWIVARRDTARLRRLDNFLKRRGVGGP